MSTAPGPGRGQYVIQGGRAKAYRPLPEGDRHAALAAALEAYDRGDFFIAHELLEPAWMGTDDPIERDLYQGIIKLAAGMVHAVRGNPLGVVNNLSGAATRLRAAADQDPTAGGLALPAILADIERCRLAAASLENARPVSSAPEPVRSPRQRRAPLALEAPRLRKTTSRHRTTT